MSHKVGSIDPPISQVPERQATRYLASDRANRFSESCASKIAG